ncbi:PEP-CTERM sorting domain-containing protein [Duganella sp. FT80W]|uniref:PEP-CTERM sorting domain-containing protein n=1 Tax=Duganella guangzhouensis TaxID=2666084 RepID=A0A6I2L8Q1_9BURK|nr:FxDxF family PEP-CTERM protein [Duganella guangzhouensis]MRW93066.1 PEP-CTERM sorting domain-containing protein [Duganella guangzhouensis]
MKLKHFVAGAVLAGASFGAFAGDQTIDLTGITLGKTYSWTALEGDGILSGGKDVITFSGLTGTYKISVTVSAQEPLTLSTLSNLSGVAGSVVNGEYVFYSSKYTGLSPYVLTLVGAANGTDADYSGTFKVTAVPEPETYAMLLGGLALVGAVARRKAKKAA